jgi:hypothetical protein
MNLSPSLASILRSGRDDFNGRFAAARRVHPELDPSAFAQFLQTDVDALVRAIEPVRPDRLAEVTQAAYDSALELVGQRLAGPGARLTAIEAAWRSVLPKAAALVASAPDRMIAAVCNAAHRLAATRDARPTQWIETMAALAPQCVDVEAFLKTGQVAAWRAGLAHFRSRALEVADALTDELAVAAIGAKPGAKWSELRPQFTASPWFDPTNELENVNGFRVAAKAGSFRGFGGLFIEPPRLVPAGDFFLVNSGNDYWLLTADAFGATFHRATKDEFDHSLKAPPMPPDLRVSNSRVTMNGVSWTLPSTGTVTSVGANRTTLAVTTQLSHTILLVALPRA